MRKARRMVVLAAALGLVVSGARAQTSAVAAGSVDPKAAFERLKGLTGEWAGTVTSKEGPPAQVRYELISGKSAVMETLFPGTDHEMRSIYHMDGSDLVMTHYCAMGNQPRMKLEVAASTLSELVFKFTGGSNLDPARDAHVHDGKIMLRSADQLEAEWAVYQGGAPSGSNRFFLSRRK